MATAVETPATEETNVIGSPAQYDCWRRNVPFIYDLCISHALEWPSLTVQWLPEVSHDSAKHCDVHRIILGTHTNEEQNHLLVATISVPKEAATPPGEHSDLGISRARNKLDIVQRINHEGEVNRARYMPQKPTVIATKTPAADVLVFDLSLHPKQPVDKSVIPDVRLKGHEKEGYGLAWNPLKRGHLISSSDDCTICLWDITKSDKTLKALSIFRGHSSVVEDVTWHTLHDNEFASVGDDHNLLIWDTRKSDYTAPAQKVVASEKEVNCVQFSPFSEFILATGGADQLVKLWDTRNLKSELHSFDNHKDEVFNLNWSPHEETVLASSGADRRLCLWDLNKIGDEQNGDDAKDGPPELLFTHAGHCAKISDFTWSPSEPWMLASVSEDNVIQAWKPCESLCESNDSN